MKMKPNETSVGSTDVAVVAFATFVLAAIAGIIFAAFAFLASWKCTSQWERSGLRSEWGPIHGCLVLLPDARWIPADRLREVDIAPRKP